MISALYRYYTPALLGMRGTRGDVISYAQGATLIEARIRPLIGVSWRAAVQGRAAPENEP